MTEVPHLRKLSVYNKGTRVRDDDNVQLCNLPTTMGKFTHNDEQLCP